MTHDSRIRVASDLRAITDMASRLRARAIDQARRHVGTSDDSGIPGGEATVNLAGVGSMTDWARRTDLHEDVAEPDSHEYEDPDELWPAEQVLWFWSEDYRRQLGHDHDDPRWRPTLVSEAKFLANRDVAEWIWDTEIHWDDYAADVARARAKLEGILREGERSERSRVTCDRCEVDPPRLVKVYAAGDEGDDRWKCPRCKHRFDDDAFRRAHATQLRSEKAEKYVALPDAIGTLKAQGRAERTIRKWLAPPLEHVADRCAECEAQFEPGEYPACVAETWDGEVCGGLLRKVHAGDPEAVVAGFCELDTRRTWVFWPDLWRLHLTTPTRARGAA